VDISFKVAAEIAASMGRFRRLKSRTLGKNEKNERSILKTKGLVSFITTSPHNLSANGR